MRGLDTNVLVRYLTQDDPAQARKVNAVFARAIASDERLHVDTVVLCELVWVLGASYDYERATIADVIGKLLDAAQLSVDDRDRVREAVRLYASGPGDFADHVLGLRNRDAGCDTTLTFDRAHKQSELFTLL